MIVLRSYKALNHIYKRLIMNNNNIITPRKLPGFMELLPAKQAIFDEMAEKIKSVYKQFAFSPLDTPVLELSEILLAKSGGDIDKELYAFSKGDTNICMRYDLTVPLARFVAMNSEFIEFPFKRYQIGKVYRGEKAQKGRFREFYQCDADIIGLETLPLIADAECLNIADKIFDKLGFKIVNHISNRNILFGYCEDLGVGDKTIDILIILDKLSKIGEKNAKEELYELGIESEKAEKLIYIASLCGEFEETLKKLSPLSQNQTFVQGIEDLKEIYSYLQAYKIPKENYCLDVGIIRGHNYYTGTVFEVNISNHPEFGAVCAGGRYDNLATYYTDKKMPGVGLSIGLTRLFDLLDKNDMLPTLERRNVDVQIIPLGDTLLHSLTLQSYFQDNGIICEINYDNRSFKGKLKEANKRNLPYIIVVGENEVNSLKYSFKDMRMGTQELLSKEECLNVLKNN